MAGPKNPGQFGNRKDTEEQARRGGEESGGSFAEDPERASEAGKKGAKHQPTEAKRRGGKSSGRP